MNATEMLTAISIPLAAFAMIFGIFYLRTRERMAMIEKNINPKQFTNLPAPFRSLKAGLLLLGAGAGLLLAYAIDHNLAERHNQEAIYFALIAMGGGIGLVTSYIMEKREWEHLRSNDQRASGASTLD